MQLIANGPDIPSSLLQAHEEGRVVFFCGAGIAYPAGLPGFKGLVDSIYDIVGTSRDVLELNAYDRGQFDAVLDLLERRLPGQRLDVRNAVFQALKPNLRLKGAKDTHAALLELARSREGPMRLVTTNFDRIFSQVAASKKLAVPIFPAPLLPIPKDSRWNGLVHLHGLLPKDAHDISALNRLVLTSGDFGLAYLTERWAARFVSELFRNYLVCFVGYSINDPVLRYMMDALAADRMLGEVTPQAYAFGDYGAGQERSKLIEWEAKGVTPILYEVPTGTQDHSALHRSLKAWSETYRDGTLGKERIVVDYAMARPSASTRQDDFVGRMLWALSDESGLPAKYFAEFDPVPPLDWLEAFSANHYRQCDLAHFGVMPNVEVDDKLAFSLVRRPAPYNCAPWMALVSGGAMECRWDDVMFHLARWLVRHLDAPELILWLAQRGGVLHDQLVRLIEAELDKFANLEREGKTDELARLRAQTPNAIPRTALRCLWNVLLTGRVKTPWHDRDLYGWDNRLKCNSLSATLRFELRELLAPKIALKRSHRFRGVNSETGDPAPLNQLVDWELVLAADHVHSFLRGLENAEHWKVALPKLLNDFQQLLQDALDLLRELGDADDTHDRSHWDLPSIVPHWQNRGFRDWVALIELLRDAWLASCKIDAVHAARIANEWFVIPYPTFKRLALFAASQGDCISSDQWVNWFAVDNAWWLWAIETGRETLRLLVLRGGQLKPKELGQLEKLILNGPPRTMFRADLEPDGWQELIDRSVWLRLAKLQSSGVTISAGAAQRLAELSAANPEWQLAENERDEFSHWMSGSWAPDFEDRREVVLAPRKRAEIVKWLTQPPSHSPFYEDNWRDTCRERFFHCALALCDLAADGEWPLDRWRDALHAWSEEERAQRSWRLIGPLVNSMPDKLLADLAHSVTWWMEGVSKTLDRHEDVFLELCNRILSMPHENGVDTDEPLTRAINHPVGHVTQALLNLLFKREPNDNDLLPAELKPIFTLLCDTHVEQFRQGRVLLSANLIALFRVDRCWSEIYLLPLFNWEVDTAEACAAWQGFLWSPRLYWPLLIKLEKQFFESVTHFAELGESAEQLAALLIYAALDPKNTFSSQEYAAALGALPQKGLDEAGQSLAQALEGAGEHREEYWINRVKPLWQKIWPKSRQLASASIAESLVELSISARGQFPDALAAVLNWLHPIEHLHHIIDRIYNSDLSARFPGDALCLLDAIIDNQSWAPKELAQCLSAISTAAPELLNDHRYKRLLEYCRRHGI